MSFIEEKQEFEDKLLKLSKDGQWEEILELAETIPLKERSRFLWVFPTKEALKFIDFQMKTENIETILSIGCGSGLLEWLIAKSTGLVLNGVELDHSWWTSKYSPRTFIKLNFTPEKLTEQFLSKASGSPNNNFALLFCYFNNGSAFREYVANFDGEILIIIGPGKEKFEITTDPKPFQPDFGKTDHLWRIIANIEIGNTQDFIVIWKKII